MISPVNGMGRLRSFKANCTPGKECVPEPNRIQLATRSQLHWPHLAGWCEEDHAPRVISALLQTRAPVRGACSATSRVQRMGKSLDRPLFGIHVPGDEILP